MERSGGVAAIVCDTKEKHSATGVLLHLPRDRGGYFGRVTKHAFLGFPGLATGGRFGPSGPKVGKKDS